MTTIFKVTHRLMLRNGDYIARVDDGKITMIFEKENVAKSTANMMEQDGLKIQFDGKNTIIQFLPEFSEEEISAKIEEELEAAKNSGAKFLRKFGYTKEHEKISRTSRRSK